MKNKKFFKILSILLILSMILTLTSCKNKKEKEVLKVGMDCAFAPFSWTQTNNTETNVKINGQRGMYTDGYDVQMALLIANDLGYELQIEMMDFDSLIFALDSNKIDVIMAGMSPTVERKEKINFSDAYYTSKHVILVKQNSVYAMAKTFEDLSGAKVIAQQSTVYDELALQLVEKNNQVTYINPLKSVPEVVNAINHGVADISILEEPAAIGITKNYPEYTYIVLTTPFEVSDEDKMVSIGLRKSDIELLVRINESLAKISEEQRSVLMQQAMAHSEDTSKIENPYLKIITEYSSLFIQGILTTLFLSFIGTTFALMIASIFAVLRTQSISPYDTKFIKVLKKIGIWSVKFYVTIIRGTPMIVQAAIFYFGFYRLGIEWSGLAAGLFTVIVNSTAYTTEIIRGGIESIDHGQLEAALSLGMSRRQAMFNIIIPQAFKNALPSIGNEFVVNIKETAVLSTITVVDLFAVADKAAGKTLYYFEALLIVALIYLTLTFVTSKLLSLLEKKLGVPMKKSH